MAAAPPPREFPHPDRVAVLVLENRSYEEVIGSQSAPYLNRLARLHTQTAIPANHYALLRTFEAHFRRPTLGQAGAQSTPLLGPLLKGG